MRISIEKHRERMANRRNAYHQRVSNVHPSAYNTSKYWPNECKAQGKR